MDFGRTYTKMPKTTQKSSAVLTRGYFPGLFAAVLALAGLARAAGNPAEKTLVFFGDSLTAGYGLADPAAEAYPALIQARIRAAGLPWRVVNAGLSGETTAGGLRRLDWTLRTPPDLFVLALGANDGLRGVPVDEMRANLTETIEFAQQSGIKVALTGMMIPPNYGPEYTESFARVFPELAEKYQLPLLPFLLEGVAAVTELNQADGIHPNVEGAKKVAEHVYPFLADLLPLK